MKIVFDINVILSALITQGLSSRVLGICIDNHHLFISKWILDEIVEKLTIKFNVPDNKIKRICEFLLSVFIAIKPEGQIPELCSDKDDNNILHLSEFIKSDLIITGDKELLKIKKFKHSKIINPRTFMEKYYKLLY